MRRRFGHRNLILYLSLSGLCLQASAEYQRLPTAIQPSELAQARQLHKQGEYYAALQRLEPSPDAVGMINQKMLANLDGNMIPKDSFAWLRYLTAADNSRDSTL